MADELNDDEKSEARSILEEADPILARIKAENAKAIESLKHPPRRVHKPRPTPTAPAEKEDGGESAAAE